MLTNLDRNGATGGFLLKAFEEFLTEARSLTFEEAALRTLENFNKVSRNGYYMPANVAGIDMQGNLYFRAPPNTSEIVFDGSAYGRDAVTAHMHYEFLATKGFIRPFKPGNQVTELMITAEGFIALDNLEKGRASVGRSAFLVRRFDLDLDSFLRPIMIDVGARLTCPIEAVWDKEHNERIDERIFRLIREAAVIVVDIAPDRFNVGLELGYALALGKPIVVIREKPLANDPEWKQRLPFDIQTLNCYDYNRSNRQELIDKLVARIGLELDKQEVLHPTTRH